MGLERLRELSKESGVRELWARDMSEEVKEAWERSKVVLKDK